MKTILFITAFVPSKISAAENYTRQLIFDLAKTNHIDLIYFKYKKDLDFEMESLNINVVKIFKNSKILKLINFIFYPVLFPLFSVRFNYFRLFIIKRLIKRKTYDLVFYDHSQVLLFSKFINNVPQIYMLHDVETQRISRISNKIITKWCELTEKWILNSKASIFCFSDKDKFLINNLFGLNSIVTNFYLEENIYKSTPNLASDYFVLFARWGRKDNLNGLKWFIRYVLPNLNKDINIKIIGAEICQNEYKSVVNYANIIILGFVDNPYPIIANAKAMISPLFTGAGVKVKVIDSLACGTPVIGTNISFEGISLLFSKYLFEANDVQSFTKQINEYKINIKQKIELKEMFISTYEINSIPKFIKMEKYK